MCWDAAGQSQVRSAFDPVGYESRGQWIDSSYSGAFGPEGTWPVVRRYVNMPGYNQTRQLEIRFTKWFLGFVKPSD